jgi:hypothetical protein
MGSDGDFDCTVGLLEVVIQSDEGVIEGVVDYQIMLG